MVLCSVVLCMDLMMVIWNIFRSVFTFCIQLKRYCARHRIELYTNTIQGYQVPVFNNKCIGRLQRDNILSHLLEYFMKKNQNNHENYNFNSFFLFK